MRILFYNWRDITHPLGGGAELYVHEIAKRLARSNEVVLYCAKYKGCKETEELEGVRIIRRGGPFSLYFYAAFEYLLKLRKQKFDVIIDSINCVPFFSPLFTRKPKLGILYHIVNAETISQELRFPASLVACAAQQLIPFIYRNVDFVTISPSTKEDLMRFGISEDKLKIVYAGVNHGPLAAGTKSEHPLITYVGVLKKYKQVDHLLKILPSIRDAVPGTQLIIAGKRNHTELEGMIKSLGLEDGVNLMGEVSEVEKVNILQKAWVFVICSVKEGWSINVIEANACGTPAIAYDVPGLRDSIKNNETGLLVPYNNREELTQAIIKVLSDAELREKLSQNALKMAPNFNWDKSAEDFLTILQGIGELTK